MLGISFCINFLFQVLPNGLVQKDYADDEPRKSNAREDDIDPFDLGERGEDSGNAEDKADKDKQKERNRLVFLPSEVAEEQDADNDEAAPANDRNDE